MNYKTGKKVNKTFSIDEGIFEAFKRANNNVSGSLQELMEVSLSGVSDEDRIKSRLLEWEKEGEVLNKQLAIIQGNNNSDEIMDEVEVKYNKKLDYALEVVNRFLRNNGEISKGRIQSIAQAQDVSFEELFIKIPENIRSEVKAFESEIVIKNKSAI